MLAPVAPVSSPSSSMAPVGDGRTLSPCIVNTDNAPKTTANNNNDNRDNRKTVRISAGSMTDDIHILQLDYDIPQEDLWFTKSEMDNIVRECQRTVQWMQQSQDPGDVICGVGSHGDGEQLLNLVMDDENNDSNNNTDDKPNRISPRATTSTKSITDSRKLDDTTITTRGLEYCTANGFDITSATSQETVRLVLAEQDRQRKEEGGNVDPLRLASLMGRTSRHRQRVSHLMGMKDARAVYGDTSSQSTQSTTTTTLGESFSSKRESRSSSLHRRRRQQREEQQDRGGIRRSGSCGLLEERTRRRRGSRGAMDRHKILTSERTTS